MGYVLGLSHLPQPPPNQTMRQKEPIDLGKEFRKLFDRFTYRRNWHDAFRDFIDITACVVHQEPYHRGLLERDDDFERIEELYMSTIKRFDKEELDLVSKFYAFTHMALGTTGEDFLGQQYMDLEIHNKHNGEYFTPTHMARMMAELSMQGCEDTIQSKGYITLQEPTCGAGVMVIEAANVIRRHGHDPRYTMLFQAIDINRVCFNMAYIQLSMLGLAGNVIHGDTLRAEVWECRATPQWKLMTKHHVPAEILPNVIVPLKPKAEVPVPQAAQARSTQQFAFQF